MSRRDTPFLSGSQGARLHHLYLSGFLHGPHGHRGAGFVAHGVAVPSELGGNAQEQLGRAVAVATAAPIYGLILAPVCDTLREAVV